MMAKAAVESAASHFNIILKEKQWESIMAFMSGRDVFVSLPTGYGKSYIYAILPKVFDLFKGQEGSIVVCISPLTSLMMEQRDKFLLKGLPTEFVGEGQTNPEAISNVLSGTIQLVYITPESLICNAMYRNMLLSPSYKNKMVALAIDEAHCVKSWGDNFRKAYAHLGELRSLLPSSVHVIALTATATKDTFRSVCSRLSLLDPVVIGLPPERNNIKYFVKELPSIDKFTSDISDDIKQLGLEYPKTIIFCQRYLDCAILYHLIRDKLGEYITFPPNYPVLQEFCTVDMYTRASKNEMKEKVLASLLSSGGKLRLVIATTAFGMGIDCPDIRVIVHWGAPESLEQYCQETGRAGRDNEPSKAVLLYGTPGKFVADEMKMYAQNTTTCRKQLLFKDFLFYYHDSSANAVNCCDVCCQE